MGTKEIIEKFKGMDTTCLSDAMDRLGIKCGCAGILPVVAGAKAVGEAFTVKYRPCGTVKGTVGDFLDDVAPGQIVVLDNGGRTYGTVWGDIMTVYAQKRGVAGTVIDGVCRDLPRILDVKYPIFTRGRFMVTGKDRVELDGLNVPVAISDVQVRPGDIMVCDDTGVVAVPADRAGEVLEIACEIDGVEQRILALLDEGMTMREARAKMGYHKLQTKK
ncbi:MAG: RraA family protein [Deltaproteobacteria bacterium]|jgi:regulator of RNase E activity RraA|nr:RraA family protein [Deltaproteobacteria bacterium]